MKGAYRIILHLLMAFTLLSLAACSDSDGDELRRIDGLCETSPKKAMSALKKIDRESLSEVNRHYYDLLRIKSADKAYVRHDSDSLIRQVLDYYEEHQSSEHYPDALYYGGRVYSDLGDYPTALRYFQSALDELPEDTEQPQLRGHALSQTGRLLNTIRLYKEAVPYLKDVIRIDERIKDTLNLIDDRQLLGAIYLHMGLYDKAKDLLIKAHALSHRNLDNRDARVETYLAAVMLKEGKIDSALNIIRGVPERITDSDITTTLSYAAQIYLKAGIKDTAYMYAERVKSLPGSNRRFGYGLLLNSELKEMIPPDSLASYYEDYGRLSYDFVERNGDVATIIQNSLYNYSIHDRERIKAEKESYQMRVWVFVAIVILLAAGIIYLIFHIRSKNKIIQLQSVISDLKNLTNNSDISKSTLNRKNDLSPKEQDLRLELRDQCLALYEKESGKINVDDYILQSDVYFDLVRMLRDGFVLTDSDPFWDRLESTVRMVSPEFKNRLQILIGRKLSTENYHMALLLKCGIRPAQIAQFVGRHKSSISFRRTTMSEQIFGENKGNDIVDGIIRQL